MDFSSNNNKMKQWAVEAPLSGGNPNFGKPMGGNFSPGIIDYNRSAQPQAPQQAMDALAAKIATIPQPGSIQHTPFSMTGQGAGNFNQSAAGVPKFNNDSLSKFNGLPVQQPMQPNTQQAAPALGAQPMSQFSAGADKSGYANQIKQSLISKGVPPEVIAQQLKALGLA